MPVLHFILKLGTWIFALIIILFVVSFLPAGPLATLAGSILTGVGALFGALPDVIQIALDRARGA